MRSTSFDLYQDIAFGFRLAAPPSSQPSRAIPDGRSDLSLPDAVSEEIANAMLRGAMLELSGGIDSRLILAAGLARGVRPRAAFTIDTGAADLETARRIARLVEVPHVEIRVEFPGATPELIRGMVGMVRGSGFRASATAVGWLPLVFRELEGMRAEQISGAGGESAAGFYWSPLDRLRRLIGVAGWARTRLLLPGSVAHRAFDRSITAEFWAESMNELRRQLDPRRSMFEWRADLDRLYTDGRLANWAQPVLTASAQHYRVSAPLMSEDYRSWASMLPQSAREGRAAQLRVIRDLAPELAAIPYGSAGMSGKPSRFSRIRRKLFRATSRMLGRARPEAVLVRETAVRISESPDVRAAVHALCSRENLDPPLDRRFAEDLLSAPGSFAHPLGACVTTAVRLGLLGGGCEAGA
jgi:hypothetical protein